MREGEAENREGDKEMRTDSPVDRRRWDQDPIFGGSDGGKTESEIGGSERVIDGREMPGVRERPRDRERGSRKGERTGDPSTQVARFRWPEPKSGEAGIGPAVCETSGGRASMGHRRRDFGGSGGDSGGPVSDLRRLGAFLAILAH